MGFQNCPPCLRNRLLPKSVHLALGVLGVTASVPVELEDLDARYVLILESRIDQQGVAEVVTLMLEILLLRVLSSA